MACNSGLKVAKGEYVAFVILMIGLNLTPMNLCIMQLFGLMQMWFILVSRL